MEFFYKSIQFIVIQRKTITTNKFVSIDSKTYFDRIFTKNLKNELNEQNDIKYISALNSDKMTQSISLIEQFAKNKNIPLFLISEKYLNFEVFLL